MQTPARLAALAATLAFSACIPQLESENGGGTAPTGEAWVAPENTWSADADGPPDGLVGEGFGVGEVLPDVRLLDQHGDEVSIWQFYGDLLVLDISTMWCAPCQELGKHTAETVETYGPDGLTYVTVLQQDTLNNTPDEADLNVWADAFGIEAPILGDDADAAATAGAIQDNTFPALLLIDRQMRVMQRVDENDAALTAAIESAI
ncbi:MAG: redoxin domain-containing protein [Deltaproteobacteria bacterium]|nr:redoxin domain-containing protein [Deltaproteobacteria bacterium]